MGACVLFVHVANICNVSLQELFIGSTRVEEDCSMIVDPRGGR